MLKDISIKLLIVLMMALLYMSTSRSAMETITNTRYFLDDWRGIYKGIGGDLANMSYLDFLDLKGEVNDRPMRVPTKNGNNNVVLFVRGDSYARPIQPSVYSFLAGYYFSNRWQTNFAYHLDKRQKNVLIIEINERHLREQYNDLRMIKYFCDVSKKNLNTNGNELATEEEEQPEFGLSRFFNKNINQNLEYNIFNYRFITPMFQAKAALNYYLFGRASGDVLVSDSKRFLILKETVVPTGTRSTCFELPESEQTLLVNNINQLYDHYKSEGFDEVYFCIVPTTVTFIQPPAKHNNMIPRIQNDPRLRMKMIDLYSVFKSDPEKYYLTGDTHWNSAGKEVWAGMVNKILEDVHSRP